MSEFHVVEYTNVQGSKIIAAQDKDGMWHALCMARPGHIHCFKWTQDDFEFDSREAEITWRAI